MTQQVQTEITNHADNPLDHVEDVLTNHNWVFNRMTDEELMVEVSGRSCKYRLLFVWQDDMSALQFCAQYDLNVQSDKMDEAAKAVMGINEALWMGHFEIPSDTRTPAFRQTCLFRGMGGGSHAEKIEDLVDISLAQCERYYAVFYVLANAASNDAMDGSDLSLAMMDIAGES